MQPGDPGLFLSGEALLCSGERRRGRWRILPAEEAEAQALLSGRGGETGEEQGEGVGAAAKEEEGGGGGGARGGLPRDPPAPVGLPRVVGAAEEEEEEEGEEAAATPAGVCVATAGPLPLPSAVRVGLAVREEGGGGGGGG